MQFITDTGEELRQIVDSEKVLLVFLRHFGCTFCRETMSELAGAQSHIEGDGYRIIIVHMASHTLGTKMLRLYDLHDIAHISDPDCELYKSYGLLKADFRAMFGVKNWWRAFVAGLVKGHLVGKEAGDPYQMPGIFLFRDSEISNRFTYRYVSDLPDFKKIVKVAS